MDLGRSLAVLVAVCAGVAVGLLTWVAWRVSRAFTWLAERRGDAAAIPVREDLLGPDLPQQENAALVYEQAFGAFRASRGDLDNLSHLMRPAYPDRSSEDAAKVRAIVEDNEEPFGLLQQAASMPECRFWTDVRDACWRELPHASVMAYAPVGEVQRARLLASQGQPEEALAALATSLGITDHYWRGAPDNFTFYLGVAVISRAAAALQDLCDEHDLPRELLPDLHARLERLDPLQAHSDYARAERARTLLGLEYGEKLPQQLEEPWLTPPSPLHFLSPWVWSHEAERAWFIEFTDEYLELARLPYRDSRAALMDHERRAQRVPWYAAATRLSASGRRLTVARRDVARAWIRICTVALDLKALHSDRGEYPRSLDQLPEAKRPGYAEDVFSGAQLNYRPEGAGFVLYSIGPDLKDDNGAPLKRAPNGTEDSGDLVWRCSR